MSRAMRDGNWAGMSGAERLRLIEFIERSLAIEIQRHELEMV